MAGVDGGFGVQLEMAETLEKVAFDLSVKQLSAQKEDLRSVRNQASVVAAISGLIATVFSSLIGPEHISKFTSEPILLWFSIEGWFVLLAFSGSILFCARVVIYRMDVTFELSAAWILAQRDKRLSVTELQQSLAEYAEGYFDENEVVISKAQSELFFALILSWLQIPAWLLLLLG